VKEVIRGAERDKREAQRSDKFNVADLGGKELK